MNFTARFAIVLPSSLALIACGSDPLPTPFLAKPLPKEKKIIKKETQSRKSYSGSPTFSGLSDSRLMDFLRTSRHEAQTHLKLKAFNSPNPEGVSVPGSTFSTSA